MFDWEEGDRFSFDDSDRFEEDSLCSWMSEPESVCNNWRGWKRPPTFAASLGAAVGAPSKASSSSATSTADSAVMSLVEIAAREVACNIPFEVVERNDPPVPEELQLRIAFWSFPENEEDIRLYSCLANGSADEFQRGENLLKARAVKDLLQIGFHLSASVVASQPSSSKGSFNVAVTFDRRRIISCSCTCTTPASSASWCSHVVSVCLFRIHQPKSVMLRAPVSESLSRLHRDQLQKFAQYLISALPQQILPTAQQLLDDLLSGQQNKINQTCGAPDPTAGASADEQTSWCLDETILHENIKKILVKLCVPSPIVFSDVNYLSSTAPPAAAEWSSLLRPLRGREPEGMWNLLSIVRELFRRGDRNAIPLLEILTKEVLICEQIIFWWFTTRVSLHAGGQNARASIHSNTHASQHACSSLCDEIVVLWRLACLNPGLSPSDKSSFFQLLHDWHVKTLERVSKMRATGNATNNGNGNGNNGNNVGPNGNGGFKRADFELFPGFKPSLEACLLRWDDYPIQGVTFTESCNRKWFCGTVHAQSQRQPTLTEVLAESAEKAREKEASALSSCLRVRGRSVEVGTATDAEKRVTMLTTEKAANGPSVSFESVINDGATSRSCPNAEVNNSRSVRKVVGEKRVELSDLPKISEICEPTAKSEQDVSNRSSFSSEGFCENSENEQFDADTMLACALSASAKSQQEQNSQSVVENQPSPSTSSENNCDKNTTDTKTFGPSTSAQSASSSNSSSDSNRVSDPAVNAPAPAPEAVVREQQQPAPQPNNNNGNNHNARRNVQLPFDSDKYVVVVKKMEDPLEILFARAEALHAHGFTRDACRLAVQLAEEMLNNPPNLMIEAPVAPVRGKRGRRFNPANHQISLLASTTLSKAAFLCSVLTENAEHHHLAFRIGLFGLELARPPASTKALEVKLANQEQDLVVLLKRMPLMSRQLQVLREKAEQLRDGRALRSRGDALLPLMMASYIFDALVLSVTQQSRTGPIISGRLPTDDTLGFEAAVAALGLKANVSEADHPLLCEGTRRQRGELTITLLVYYKDDQEKLAKIMDKLLDKEVHQMYKSPIAGFVSACGGQSTKTASDTPCSPSTSTSTTGSTVQPGAAASSQPEAALSSSNSDESLESRDQVLPEPSIYPNADSRPSASAERRASERGDGASSPVWADKNYKEWEARFRCTNLKTAKKHSVGMASIDSSAPETTSSDNSPTVIRRTLWMKGGPGSDSGSSGESSDSFASSSSGSKALKAGKLPGGAVMSNVATAVIPAESGQNGVVTITNRLGNCSLAESAASVSRAAAPGAATPSNATQNSSPQNNPPSSPGSAAGVAVAAPIIAHLQQQQQQQPGKPTRFKGKRPYPSIPNQPSEASAHFMFELAKTVLTKAGGNSSNAVLFTQQSSGQSHRGPHRALHMCAFQIGVYALGLHNVVSPNWLSRTYSSHVSWITGQAMEIGASAISFLIDTWECHLTPPEVASLADKASRNRDPAMVRAAAKLALSCLPHAHALNPNEIQRALIQCKEQSSDMLEQACLAVESAAKGGGVYPEVLFEVARKWFELYEESLQEPTTNARTNRRAAPFQASVGEFAVSSANNSAPSNVNNGEQQARVDNPFIGQNIVQQQASMQVLQSCGPTFGLPTGTPAYSYGFYPPFGPGPPLHPHMQLPQVHPAYMPGGGAHFPYNPFYQGPTVATTSTGTIVTAMPPHLRGVLPPGAHLYPGQPMISSNVIVTQASAISQAQHRFQLLTGQPLQGPNGHHHMFHHVHAHALNHLHSHHHSQQPLQQLNQRQLTHLLSAYRVGMLALETLARRVVDDRPQAKYARNPSYGEDVKWLLNCAKKLGTSYLQDFCICAVNSVASPFVLYEIILDAAQYLSQQSSQPLSQPLRSALIAPLLQKCQQMFISCTHFKMYHIIPADYEEFVQVVRAARSAFQLTPGGMQQFNELLQSLRRSKSCKKDLWVHLNNSLQQQTPSNLS